MKVNDHERQRYHALILVHGGYSYREVGQILLVDEQTISRWVRQSQEGGLGGVKNDPSWSGEHGQRELSAEELNQLKRILREEAMPGTKVGSGWTNKAVRQLIADGARQKKAENLYGAVHLGTGAEVAPFAIDWQDSDATIRWYEMILEACPTEQILIWQDQAPHHTSEEVEEWLAAHRRIRVIEFPKYTPKENPKEATWKDLKEEVSHHHWHEAIADLRKVIEGLASEFSELTKVDQIWIADTVAWNSENYVYFGPVWPESLRGDAV